MGWEWGMLMLSLSLYIPRFIWSCLLPFRILCESAHVSQLCCNCMFMWWLARYVFYQLIKAWPYQCISPVFSLSIWPQAIWENALLLLREAHSLLDLKRKCMLFFWVAFIHLAIIFPSCKTNPLIHYSRHFGCTVHAFCYIQSLLSNRIICKSNNSDLELSPEHVFVYQLTFLHLFIWSIIKEKSESAKSLYSYWT